MAKETYLFPLNIYARYSCCNELIDTDNLLDNLFEKKKETLLTKKFKCAKCRKTTELGIIFLSSYDKEYKNIYYVSIN